MSKRMTRPPRVVYATKRERNILDEVRVRPSFGAIVKRAREIGDWNFVAFKGRPALRCKETEFVLVGGHPENICVVWWACLDYLNNFESMVRALFGSRSQADGAHVLWGGSHGEGTETRRMVARAALALAADKVLGRAAPDERIVLVDTTGITHDMIWMEAIGCDEEVYVKCPERGAAPTCARCIAARVVSP
jgi:hypothetical protein